MWHLVLLSVVACPLKTTGLVWEQHRSWVASTHEPLKRAQHPTSTAGLALRPGERSPSLKRESPRGAQQRSCFGFWGPCRIHSLAAGVRPWGLKSSEHPSQNRACFPRAGPTLPSAQGMTQPPLGLTHGGWVCSSDTPWPGSYQFLSGRIWAETPPPPTTSPRNTAS